MLHGGQDICHARKIQDLACEIMVFHFRHSGLDFISTIEHTLPQVGRLQAVLERLRLSMIIALKKRKA